MSAKVIRVIRAEIHRGAGIKADPHRTVVQYFALDGTLLWQNDPRPEPQPAPREETRRG